jgi:transcriptional regulator with XRE-family HTH domain
MTKEFLRKLVGNNIRNERTASNMTLYEFSERLGLTPGFVGLIERGKRGATAYDLYKISEVFKISVDDLFLCAPENLRQGSTESKKYGDDSFRKNEVLTLIKNLSDRELDYIIFLIKGVIEMNGKDDMR